MTFKVKGTSYFNVVGGKVLTFSKDFASHEVVRVYMI